ncbi:putative mucin/carbohydrate-binding domain-containing protein [Enterococcus rivorum]|uniref:putative mucin/carbohydrate-binding domain-containing protein n=1 Tax=Enterococcus rivorum TaxID=762845 RepID=UPI003639EA9F
MKGTKIRLKEGNKVVQEKEITSESVLFNQLPNGVYTIEFVGEVMTKYIASQQYLYVKESENNIEIKLSKLNVSSFMNQSINFLGLSDRKFGEFKTNLNEGTGTVSVTSATPHKYYSGETYMTVKVSDENGVEKYSKVIEGTEVTVKSETISLVEGDRVEIYHAETRNRLTSTEEIINKTEKPILG